MPGMSRRVKRLLQQCRAEAHERELHRELTKLDRSFEEWRRGEIGSGELSERIHQFHQGPSRALFKRYNYGDVRAMVAYAIVGGVLDKEQVPAELFEAIEGPLGFFQSLKDSDELKMPAEM